MAEYAERYELLLPLVPRLEKLLREYLHGIPHVDRISARAKHPERFAAKAAGLDNEGNPKYAAPLDQIQDQVGARIIVFYLDDLRPVRDVIERYFRRVEARELVPDDHWTFGYFGFHWVFPFPEDLIPDIDDPKAYPRFFELQVKTLFQHAWSEANHDLGYKPPQPLTPAQERRFAYTAAQAWGADRVFEELRAEILNVDGPGNE